MLCARARVLGLRNVCVRRVGRTLHAYASTCKDQSFGFLVLSIVYGYSRALTLQQL